MNLPKRIPALPPQAACGLCGGPPPLRRSHLIPSFLIQSVKEGSATGFIRSNDAPNRREQDGQTFNLLCGGCESTFSPWEKAFAERIYYPGIADGKAAREYASWMSRFAASVVWRVVRVYQLHGELPPPEEAAFAEAEQVWREFLLGNRPNVGKHELYLFPMDGAVDIPSPGAVPHLDPIPANINRFMLTAMFYDLVIGDRTAFVIVKVPRYLLIGMARAKRLPFIEGARLPMRKGRISPRRYTASTHLMNYLFSKAREMDRMLGSISPAQRAKIQETLRANPERFRQSVSAEAMILDLNLFGQNAFSDAAPREDDVERDASADAASKPAEE